MTVDTCGSTDFSASLGHQSLSGKISNLIFVDSSVAGYQKFLGVKADNTQILVLDSSKDGIAQISKALSHYDDIDSVQIVSHGAVGCVKLGSSRLSADSLSQYQKDLKNWSKSLANDGDLLFYGCNVGAGAKGVDFVKDLAKATGADVAASDDLTGCHQKGGDWALEVKTGDIETKQTFTAATASDFDDILYTFRQRTLRAADVTDFTRLGYTYDIGYNNTPFTLPAGAARTTGLGVRKSATSLTSSEITAFINAIRTLKNTPVVTPNGITTNVYDQFVATHAAVRDAQGRLGPNGITLANPGHMGSAFGPWHRAFLYEFEKALQTVDPNVTIPYWDWTAANARSIFRDDFMGPDGDPNLGNQVRTGFFSRAQGWNLRRDLTTSRWQGLNASPVALTRSLGGTNRTATLGTVANITATLGQTTYPAFRNALEGTNSTIPGMHNQTHGWINGIMNNVTAAANDPMFWLVHANVDRIWAQWQLTRWGNNFYPATGQPYGHNLNDPMYLWDGGIITSVNSQLRDLCPTLPDANTALSNKGKSGKVVNPGPMDEFDSIGVGKVAGAFKQQRGDKLTIEIAGRQAGKKYDVLKVDRGASLKGTLNLYFVDGFQPKVGDKFEIVKADKVKGDFNDIKVYGLKKDFKLDYTCNDGTYVVKVVGVNDDKNGQPTFGFAQTRKQLKADKTGTLFNPAFGECITDGHFLYESRSHHMWGNKEKMHHNNSDWFVPTNINESKVLQDISNGGKIPEKLHAKSPTGEICPCDDDGMTPSHNHASHNHDDHDHHHDEEAVHEHGKKKHRKMAMSA